jgi:hypothetical protein
VVEWSAEVMQSSPGQGEGLGKALRPERSMEGRQLSCRVLSTKIDPSSCFQGFSIPCYLAMRVRAAFTMRSTSSASNSRCFWSSSAARTIAFT